MQSPNDLFLPIHSSDKDPLGKLPASVQQAIRKIPDVAAAYAAVADAIATHQPKEQVKLAEMRLGEDMIRSMDGCHGTVKVSDAARDDFFDAIGGHNVRLLQDAYNSVYRANHMPAVTAPPEYTAARNRPYKADKVTPSATAPSAAQVAAQVKCAQEETARLGASIYYAISQGPATSNHVADHDGKGMHIHHDSGYVDSSIVPSPGTPRVATPGFHKMKP